MRLSTSIHAVSAAMVLALAGCGGGGGGGDTTAASTTTTTTTTTGGTGGTTTTPATPTTLVGVFVDGPVDGLLYSAQPSGLSGTTGNGGQYKYQPGDTVTFSIATGGTPLVIATRVHGSGTVATNTFVSSVPNGLQVAAVLQALDTGVGHMDVGGLTIPAAIAQEIGNYISSGGTNVAGQPSEDQFLRHLQTSVTAPRVFAHTINGTSNRFLAETVVPNMQAGMAASPAAAFDGKVSKLSGGMTIHSTGTAAQVPGCTQLTVTGDAGGIINVTVQGDIGQAGAHQAVVTAGSFHNVVRTSDLTCTAGTSQVTTPGQTTVDTIAGGTSNQTFTVNGSTLTVTWPSLAPAGCTGGNQLTGTMVGAANPMMTLTGQLACNFNGTTINAVMTVKLVGSM